MVALSRQRCVSPFEFQIKREGMIFLPVSIPMKLRLRRGIVSLVMRIRVTHHLTNAGRVLDVLGVVLL